MSLSTLAVKRPVTTVMFVLVVVAFGILSVFNLNMDMMPNMNIPVAIVSTSYSGVGSEEMENLITKPIEEVLGTVSGMKEMQSISSYGSSIVVVQFEDDVDIDDAALTMRERIDLIKSYLPDGADEPMVIKVDINSMTSLTIGVTSQNLDMTSLRRMAEEKIQGRLERQDGVASVSLSGGREQEISVVLKEDKIRGYGISESTLIQLLAAENRSIPTGSVKQGDKDLSLRVSGEFESLEDIKSLPIPTATGGTVYLRDVAEVEQVYKDASTLSYINGVPSVTFTIQKQSTANTVRVSDAVFGELERIRQEMPDISILTIEDPAKYIRTSLSNVAASAIQGGMLAVIILYLFLRNLRSTLIVAASMPISIVATFTLMYYGNIDINMMSLGGLTLGVGLLVDNSIVVIESIFRKVQEGDSPFEAAVEGAREIATPVIASTLTTVAVFLPITFVGGLTAEIFNQLALTITFSLLSSLVVSLTFVPMCCSLLLRANQRKGNKRSNVFTKVLDIIGAGIDSLEKWYRNALAAVLKWRKVTILATVAILAVTFYAFQFIGSNFMPATDESGVNISISMPKGTVIEETERTAWSVIDTFKNDPEFKDVITDISLSIGGDSFTAMFGGSGGDSANITVGLVGKAGRSLTSQECAALISKRTKNIAGCEITVNAVASSMGNMAGGDSLVISITGEDLDELGKISKDFVSIISSINGAREVETSIEEASPQATIKINRDKANAYGISAAGVSSIINTSVAGTVATTYKIDFDEYDVRVRHNKDSLNYINDVKNILIPSAFGINVPLYEIADIETSYMPVSINRLNQQRIVEITCRVEGITTGEMSEAITKKIENEYYMPSNYSWEFSGTTKQMEETFGNLGYALIMSVLLIYMIMAGQFESLINPFIIMLSIPIALTGGLTGLLLTGQDLTIPAFLGLIMLAGIVINNAIVLIDYTNLLRRERNYNMLEALQTAGPVRLRPILMTTLTTVIALLPMILSNSDGADLMRGLATVVVFGLTLSMLVTLLFIPVVYAGMDSLKVKWVGFRKKEA